MTRVAMAIAFLAGCGAAEMGLDHDDNPGDHEDNLGGPDDDLGAMCSPEAARELGLMATPSARFCLPRKLRCRLGLTPHRGGDAHHNQCADREPPNQFPGRDVVVSAPLLPMRLFDAMDPQGAVWEVKTERWSAFSVWLQEIIETRLVAQIVRDAATARACGLAYVVGVADRALVRSLQREFGQSASVHVRIVHLPRCVRP